MKKKAVALIAVVTLTAACSSSDYDEPQPQRAPRAIPARAASAAGIDVLPPDDWWREPAITGSLNLTSDQLGALDRIAADQRDEIAKLERDSMTGMRDLRLVLEANQPSTAEITAAGSRVRALHDALFDRQVIMLAAERNVLTQQQWQQLQQALQSERSQRRNDPYGGQRGRGRMGGRGRWPGF